MAEPLRVLVLFGGVVLYGAERGNLEALAALKRQGAEILCLISDERWNTILPSVLEERGIKWRRIPYVHVGKRLNWLTLLWENPLRFMQANMAFLRAIREFKPTHIHTYAQIYAANFCWGLIRTGVPLVFRAGDEPTLHNFFWRIVWRFVVWRTARFVANSQFVARSLRTSGVPSDHITVIYNTPPARISLQRAKLELRLPATACAFGYIGQISEHKGPHVLIDAFRELAAEFPRMFLLLAGRISDWEGDAWARALRDKTQADPLIRDRVTFLGEIEDVAALLARCEALVVPSLFDDPSPNVVMEAKLAGRPVIAFPRGGLPELIENGVDGLLCREATKPALIRALRAYLENSTMARQHGAAAAATSSRFGNARFLASWSEVYAAATCDRRRGSLVVSP